MLVRFCRNEFIIKQFYLQVGLFKGKSKSGLTLSLRKNYAKFNFTRSYYQREHNQLDTDNLQALRVN